MRVDRSQKDDESNESRLLKTFCTDMRNICSAVQTNELLDELASTRAHITPV